MEIKKILITGANGYLGGQLSNHLNKRGFQITGLCRTQKDGDSELISQGIYLIYGDISELETKYKKQKLAHPDAIIHLVSLNHFQSETDFDSLAKVNYNPTGYLIENFQKAGLKKFIYFSTQQVYGRIPAKNISENQNVNPVNKYGLSHLISENIVNFFHNNNSVEAFNLRLSNGFGSPLFENQNCWKLVVNDFVSSAFKSGKIIIKSDGTPVKDFIHISDITNAVELILKSENNSDYNTFNLSSGTSYMLIEVALKIVEAFKNKFNKKVDVILQNKLFSKDDMVKSVEKYSISNKRLAEAFNYKSETSIDQGISEIINYLIDKNE